MGEQGAERFIERATVALTVHFRKWSRRHPWECRRCGAAVVDIDQHARWHASNEAGAREVRPDPGQWAEGWPSTIHDRAVTVTKDGWQL